MNLLGISTIIKNGEDSRKNHAVFKVDSQQIIQAIRSVVEPIPTGNFISNQGSTGPYTDTNVRSTVVREGTATEIIISRFPYLTTSPEGQETGCCNGKTYDIKGPLECCDDKRLVNVGNCVPKITS